MGDSGFNGQGTGTSTDAFSLSNNSGYRASSTDTRCQGVTASFDASKVISVASENRPYNIALLPLIAY